MIIYSKVLADYLQALRQEVGQSLLGPPKRVAVRVRVTSDCGCMRGFNVAQIGELEQWSEVASFFRITGNTPGPFSDEHWWCPN